MSMADNDELRERIDKLKSLARDLYDNLWIHQPKCAEAFSERMAELGIEVDA